MKIWKVILATLVIFGAGVVTGGLLVNHVVRIKDQKKIKPLSVQAVTPWQQHNRELLHRMDRELNLTPEQHDRLEKIIIDGQERTKALWKPIAPQMNKESQRVRSELRDELTPEQRKKFDELVKPHPKKQDDKQHHPGTNTAEISTNSPATNSAVTNQ
ncbi:hypothetical protein [Pedosphaera parvula]|uniref:Uncharacterized protein n=1 Tax=Pedosphaera parvula (strain Ellin514) TaxID=320771 RepID=B9XMD2_PEDPL|nr:hypothetical protein [Pedosphaera parvula]EEF58974.1 hypothetical protein Cflav_PD2023 [Pedosphaera parvula Ellin514]